jgi:hypothetical protein
MTWKVGHRIYSIFFPTMVTNNRTLQKKEPAEELLTIHFDKTLHNGYFEKLPFGSKDKFAKNDQYYITIAYVNVVMPA